MGTNNNLVSVSTEDYEELVRAKVMLEIVVNLIKTTPSYSISSVLTDFLGIKDDDNDV